MVFFHGFLLVKNTWKTYRILPNPPVHSKDNFLKLRIQNTGDRTQETFVIEDLRMTIDDFSAVSAAKYGKLFTP